MQIKEKKNSDQHFNPIRVNGVRTLQNSGSTGSRRFGRACSDGPDARGPRRFTNTAIPRFDGTGCWQQHLLIFRAIMKSNGWSMTTAALQLFASRIRGVGRDCQPGKKGWSVREGQPPRPSMIVTHLTPVGGSVVLGDALRLGDNRRVAPVELGGPRMPRAFQFWGASLLLKKNVVIVRFQIAAIWWWHET